MPLMISGSSGRAGPSEAATEAGVGAGDTEGGKV